MMTSHPKRAPSAADIVSALKGIEFPVDKEGLVEFVGARGEDSIAQILADLPSREYRDSAEVTRALGEIVAQESKPGHQPSVKGGAEAMKSLSAARFASLFSGIEFPASVEDLIAHTRGKASNAEMEVVENFRDRRYSDMSDVAKEFSRAR